MSPQEMMKQLKETRNFLKSKNPDFPKYAIVLGSGLSALLDEVKVENEIPYGVIPHLKIPTVQGHAGKLVIGKLGNTRVVCLKGRLHYYEGLPMRDVVFPFRAIALAGSEVFLLTNASGGLHPKMKPMDLLLIQDHINLMGTNPLIGPNAEELGPRFPDMTRLYDPKLSKAILSAAKRLRIPMRSGVYVGTHGPSFETPAEIRMYRRLGADVVGMSTVPEAIALNHMGKRVVGISCITNLAAGLGKKPLVHDEVLEAGKKIHHRFSKLVVESIERMRAEHEQTQ